MNREILFRGKRVDNGEWVEGIYSPVGWDFFDEREDKPYIMAITDDSSKDGYWFEIIRETRGQYTGLTDRNGNKIFEGDIIECDLERFIVEWDDEFAGFYLSDIYPDYQGCATLSDVSKNGCIIGNIHDNPELMGGKNEFNC